MDSLKLITGSIITGLVYYFKKLGFDCDLSTLLLIAIVTDIITGVWAAYSIDKRSLKSSIMTSGILKKAGVVMVPFLMGIAIRGAGFSGIGTITTICSFLICSEVYSSLGNYYSIRRGERVHEIDAVDLLISWARRQLIGVLRRFQVADEKVIDDDPKDLPHKN